MLSLKNVKSPDSNFVNFPKVGAYGTQHRHHSMGNRHQDRRTNIHSRTIVHRDRFITTVIVMEITQAVITTAIVIIIQSSRAAAITIIITVAIMTVVTVIITASTIITVTSSRIKRAWGLERNCL